jgi:hypothetical protein
VKLIGAIVSFSFFFLTSSPDFFHLNHTGTAAATYSGALFLYFSPFLFPG